MTLADNAALCPDTSLRLLSSARAGSTARAPRELSTTLPPLPGAAGTLGLPGASAQAARTLQGSLQFHYTVRSRYHFFFCCLFEEESRYYCVFFFSFPPSLLFPAFSKPRPSLRVLLRAPRGACGARHLPQHPVPSPAAPRREAAGQHRPFCRSREVRASLHHECLWCACVIQPEALPPTLLTRSGRSGGV